MEAVVERYQPPGCGSNHRVCPSHRLPGAARRNRRTTYVRRGVPGRVWSWMVETPCPIQDLPPLAQREDVPGVAEERDCFVIIVLPPIWNIMQRHGPALP